MVIVPIILLGFCGMMLFGGRAPLFASFAGQNQSATHLTMIARADGTFDIKEFPKADQWFAPDAVGEGLKRTAVSQFGAGADVATVDVMVQADPGAKDDDIRLALNSARMSGFVRFGFADPRVGEVARQVASTSAPTVPSPAVAAR